LGFYTDEHGNIRKISPGNKPPDGTIIWEKRPNKYSVHARRNTTYFEPSDKAIRDLGVIIARNEPDAYRKIQEKFPNEHDLILKKLSRVIDPSSNDTIH